MVPFGSTSKKCQEIASASISVLVITMNYVPERDVNATEKLGGKKVLVLYTQVEALIFPENSAISVSVWLSRIPFWFFLVRVFWRMFSIPSQLPVFAAIVQRLG